MRSDSNRNTNQADLIGLNLRGAVFPLVEFVPTARVLNHWQRAGYVVLSTIPDLTVTNVDDFKPVDVYSAFAKDVDWTNATSCQRALRAMSGIMRDANRIMEYRNDDQFRWLWQELELACQEDGFTLDGAGTISQAEVIRLDDFDMSGIDTVEGVMRQVKKLNRAITQDRDHADVIGHAKSLVEAVAASILAQQGMGDDEIRNLKVHERTVEVQKQLGIDGKSAAGSLLDALAATHTSLNRITQSVGHMRRDRTDAGHGIHTLPDASPEEAQLAVDAALAWCRYVLGVYQRNQGIPPF